MLTTVPFNILWAVGQVGKNKPTDVAAAQVLFNLASKDGIPKLAVDGKWSPQLTEALTVFETKYMRRSTVSLSLEPSSTTIRALIVAAIPKARMATHFPTGKGGTISDGDYQAAAQSLGCEVAAIKAVASVESRGRGFLPSGRPKILFESHVFSKFTKHVYDPLFPDISTRHQAPALYKGGELEYVRLMKAMLLDRSAALRAASWGKFQILGFNCNAAGSPDLESFISAMFQSEGAHLNAFCALARTNKLVKYLKDHDWAAFAAAYNGPEYWKKHYDRRMKEEFERAQGGKHTQGGQHGGRP